MWRGEEECAAFGIAPSPVGHCGAPVGKPAGASQQHRVNEALTKSPATGVAGLSARVTRLLGGDLRISAPSTTIYLHAMNGDVLGIRSS